MLATKIKKKRTNLPCNEIQNLTLYFNFGGYLSTFQANNNLKGSILLSEIIYTKNFWTILKQLQKGQKTFFFLPDNR